jgi:F420-dependent oxidoreductase-like protein
VTTVPASGARRAADVVVPAVYTAAAAMQRVAMQERSRTMGDVGLMGMHVPGMSWREIRDAAVFAEELGYSCITMGESWGEDAPTSLAQLAAVTSRVRIGTSIVPVFARSPANLAMTALNLDRMSEGRFFLGLGTSGRLVIEDFHGEKFAKPLTRMREYIDIIRKAARGERLDHAGEFFQTRRFQLRFTPYRPDLPIYIAALSPPSLRLTGELADGWLPIFLAPARMASVIADLRAGAEAAGRSLRDIAIAPQVSIYVTDDRAGARDRERQHIAFYIGGMGVFYHQYMHRIGFGAEADRVRYAYQAREREKAAHLVTDELVDAMTIIGTPRECRDQMQAFFAAGVQEIRLVFNEPNKEAYLKALRAVAPRG